MKVFAPHKIFLLAIFTSHTLKITKKCAILATVGEL
jgi:hypothetical protein